MQPAGIICYLFHSKVQKLLRIAKTGKYKVWKPSLPSPGSQRFDTAQVLGYLDCHFSLILRNRVVHTF